MPFCALDVLFSVSNFIGVASCTPQLRKIITEYEYIPLVKDHCHFTFPQERNSVLTTAHPSIECHFVSDFK